MLKRLAKIKAIISRPLLVKLLAYLVIFYLLLVTVSVGIAGYLFFNLEEYKQKISDTVYSNTGFKLHIGSIHTTLNRIYLPELAIGDLTLTNPKNPEQVSHVDAMNFVLDYSSIWHLQPIFNEININGAAIKLDYESSGALFLNGIQITDPADQTLENTKTLPFDLEGWLLRQGSIKLDNISFAFHDKKNNLPEVKTNKITFIMNRRIWARHHAEITTIGKVRGNIIRASLDWQGGKFEHWQKWRNADLKVKIYENNAALLNEISTYLPDSMVESSNATTAFSAQIKDGLLQKVYANFDVNNFKLALADVDIVNVPRFGGLLNIDLVNGKDYQIKAKNLQVATSSGALFDDAQINGHYTIGESGNVELSNTNLVALNNLLSLFNNTNGIFLQGVIKNITYTWNGYFTEPKLYSFASSFENISIKSNHLDLPSLSNVSGDVVFNQKSGSVNLNLKNSVLNYDSVFLIPYDFKYLNTKMDWSISESKVVTVVMHKTQLATKDFAAVAQGKFIYNPNNTESPSYIDMTAHVDKVLTSKVGDYLPKQIPMSVHEWLNMGLVSGYAESADLVLYGPLGNFPFQDNSGLFYITANIDNAKLQYVKDWPPLENIYGKFILRNTDITIKADRAFVNKNHLDHAVVDIPDYGNPNGVELIADGTAHGSTANFLDYLTKTPINNIIGKFPEKVTAEGDSKLQIHLKIPFKDVKHTEVKGTLGFENNNLEFELPIPKLYNVNGPLGFTQHGVNSTGLHVNVFNSPVTLYANTNDTGKMHFWAVAPQLDYNEVSKFYLPIFTPIISGSSSTNIDFTIGKKGLDSLSAKSNLVGVSLNAPAPLGMESAAIVPLNLTINPTSVGDLLIAWSYGNIIHGEQLIGKSINSKGQIAAGENVGYLDNPSPGSVITVNAGIPEVNIEQWIATVNKIVSVSKQNKLARESDATLKTAGKLRHNNVMPLQIKIASPHLMLGKNDLGDGTANIIVDTNQTYFNMYSQVASGYGLFNYADHKIKLTLDKYMLYKKLPATLKASESYIPLNFVNGSKTTAKINVPDIDLNIKNLFYQNHNLGNVAAKLHQDGDNLYMNNGVLSNNDGSVNFSATNYCFGCDGGDSYVNFIANANVLNLGNLIYDLDFGRIVSNGKGTANATLQWNGGFQDFKIFQTVGTFKGEFYSGKFLQIDPGVVGSVFSIINLQGIFEFAGGDVGDIFKKGFYFNSLSTDIHILTSRIELKNVEMEGPLAAVRTYGILDFANNTIDAEFGVTPRVGFAVALVAGIATLNPIVGVAVYGAELLTGGAQDKLFTMRYHVTGSLHKPKVDKTDVKDNLLRNMNSTVGLDQ